MYVKIRHIPKPNIRRSTMVVVPFLLKLQQQQQQQQQQLLLLLLLPLVWLHMVALPALGIGVNYGMKGNDLPPPAQVVELLKKTSIDSVKLYNADAEVLSAFANTGISVVVGVENELLLPLARSSRAAQIWVKQHILPYYPSTAICAIAVGNEVLTMPDRVVVRRRRGNRPLNQWGLLLPAMKNLHQALYSLLGPAATDTIKISTPSSMAILSSSSPPSSAAFKPSLLPYIQDLLQFLSHTSSPLMINIYPYFAYATDPQGVPLDFALFAASASAPALFGGVRDPASGLVYGSLFDAQLDAIYYAMMKAVGAGSAKDTRLPEVLVSETGWPSKGDPGETGANARNAEAYNANLVKRVASRAGTPLLPDKPPPRAYIFALFNEDEKTGPESERNFGLYRPDMGAVYDTGLGTSSTAKEPPSVVSGGSAGFSGVWCVAGPGASEEDLRAAIGFACGEEGGADCSAIQEGQPCFGPDTLAAHASYAMNSYYQLHGRNYWNCFFNASALVTATNPSYGSCTYPSQ